MARQRISPGMATGAGCPVAGRLEPAAFGRGPDGGRPFRDGGCNREYYPELFIIYHPWNQVVTGLLEVLASVRESME
jgi:hypothetical protein